MTYTDPFQPKQDHANKVTAIGIILFLLILAVCHTARGEEVNLDIIAQTESNGDALAYNSNSGARGLCQITPIVLREYNDWSYKNYLTCYEDGFLDQPIAYKKKDLYMPNINKQIATWYMNIRIPQLLKHFKLEDTTDARLACYNAGIGVYLKYKRGKRKLPKETRNYIYRYHQLAKGAK